MVKLKLPFGLEIEFRKETDEERRARVEREWNERFERASKKYLKERK